MQCGFPSASQFLDAIDSEEWTELLAFYVAEYTEETPTPLKPSTRQVERHLDQVLGGSRRGSHNRKAQHNQHAR